MAHPLLAARFFARPDGTCVERVAPLTERQRLAAWDRGDGICSNCGVEVARPGSANRRYDPFRRGPIPADIDHALPRRRGGQNTTENLRVCCYACNRSKGAMLGATT